MFTTTLAIAGMFAFALQAASSSPTPMPVTIVSAKHFWPETFVEWSGLVSAIAVIVGAIWALRSYREAQRIKAAEVLLKMEEEFRTILPIYELIENPGVYEAKTRKMLAEVMKGSDLSADKIKELADLDRCLRFLFLCSVLNRDLAVEQNVLFRAYYHYVNVLAKLIEKETKDASGLAAYLKEFYPTLSKWTNENKDLLVRYRSGKLFEPRPWWKVWEKA